MAYTPTEWKCGDTITAEKLNKMEDGIANAGGGSEPLIFTATEREATTEECPLGLGGAATEYSHSWQEVHDTLASGKVVLCREIEGDSVYLHIITDAVSGTNGLYIATSNQSYEFTDADSKVLIHCNDR